MRTDGGEEAIVGTIRSGGRGVITGGIGLGSTIEGGTSRSTGVVTGTVAKTVVLATLLKVNRYFQGTTSSRRPMVTGRSTFES